jgi:hypothetical protein
MEDKSCTIYQFPLKGEADFIYVIELKINKNVRRF